MNESEEMTDRTYLGCLNDDRDDAERVRDTELIERLAAYAHDAWSHWMKHLFSKCFKYDGFGSTQIPKEFVERWTHQMNTPYDELSEEEKASDRKEAEKILKLIQGSLGELK